MANELDKFVLEYVVEIRDSLKKLDSLQKKMEQTQKASSHAGDEVRDFASKAGDEIGKLVPGVDKVTAAVRSMGAEFSIAAVGIAAIAAAIKSVIDMRELYNAQRKQGQEAGIGTIRAEEYRRKFRKYGEGRVDDKTAADTIKKISDLGMRAYLDPTRMSATEAKQMKLLGLPVGKGAMGRAGITNTNQLVGMLGERLAGMPAAQAAGVGRGLGLDTDATMALRKMGKSAGQITELSSKDIDNRIKAQDTLTDFNKALSDMNEKFKEAELQLGEKLLPALTKFVELLAKIADKLPDAIDRAANAAGVAKDAAKKGKWGTVASIAAMASNPLAAGQFLFGGKGKMTPEEFSKSAHDQLSLEKARATEPFKAPWYAPWRKGPTDQDKREREKSLKSAEAIAAAADKQLAASRDQTKVAQDQKELNDKVAGYDEKFNETSRDTEAQFGLAVNMFAGAVASFSNAIDEKQAWAAWAGEVGRAAGLGSGRGASESGRDTGGSSAGGGGAGGVPAYNKAAERQYEPLFEAAAAKYNVPIALLKAHVRVESNMNPNAVSEAGAQGLGQLLPSTAKALGVKNSFDPAENLMGTAKLIRENLDRYGDVNRAIMAYHGGTNEANWGPKTQDYLVKVNRQLRAGMADSGSGVDSSGVTFGKPTEVRGVTRNDMQKRMVQQNIASRLGVPVNQLQVGEVNRGDVEFASSQLEGGIGNNIFQLQKQQAYEGLPLSEKARIANEIRTQSSGLELMNRNSADVIGASREGSRDITFGERAVIINVSGSTDPKETAKAVHDKFTDQINDIVNGASDGMKY